MSDDRPNVYIEESGLVVYRASSVGMCVRALVAISHGGYEEAMGKERVELLQRTADEGDLHEGAVRSKLEKEGWVVHSAQETIEVPVLPGVVIRGHTDGIISSASTQPHMLLEVKSMSNKRFDRWIKQGFDGFLKYAYQLSTYMKAHEGMDVVYVVKRREDGKEDRRIIKASEPPISFKEVRKKVLIAEGFRRKQGAGFPACDVPRSEQWWCPFWYLHEEEVDADLTEMTDEMRAILIDLIPKRLEFSELEKEGKEAEGLRKELDKEILNLMGDRDQVIVEVDGVNFQVTRVNGGGTSLDQAGLREYLGEDIMQFEKPYKFQYPKITEKKGKKGTDGKV